MGRHTVLAGRYELLSPLGRGGMGQVWEGQDQRLGRRVAVKLLTREVLADRAEPNDLVRRFAREAAVMAGLQHPGVPAVYDAGTYDGGLFLVLELVDGCTLGDLIAEQGPLPVAWAAGIAAQMAAVLTSAHERRFVHRDVKPQNVMLTRDGTVKVLDFGVAALLDQAEMLRITSTGETIGTLAYMAPEQLHSRDTTPRTDLYALGCVLYEMLAGAPMFEATSPGALIHKHLSQTPAPLLREDVHPELERLVMQLLEKEPEQRPADARETYDRLLPYVTTGPGPLGDVDPVQNGQSGMHLYSRVLVRLSSPAGAAPTGHAAGETPGEHWAPHAGNAYGAVPPSTGDAGFRWPRPDAVPSAPRYGRAGRATHDPYGTGAPQHATEPRAPRGAVWTFTHSLWIAPTLLFGVGAWLSFAYIAARHRRPSWLIAALTYLALAIVSIALIGSAPELGNPHEADPPQVTIGVVLILLLWPAGFVHALWINATTRLPLRARMEDELRQR
ncbi:serine/threonine-protein kinase [Planotetraspora kaengkrachanensis]|uniref:non-specific serine/threonine protein kinase n=1 Tax=Planotetraspora kaengkrachanensis TaxID=575193 RepID=A0A8J3V8J4_9ACTN|nr:serine/threonine-protein kinase [Planotetraspora kaengkrachanensis]GIG81958.1 hypothetical protein Pka01_50850 [Planotetraspora kaengkrachanensis]